MSALKNEALKLALKSLEFYYNLYREKVDAEAIAAIKEALAQPNQDPHGWYIDGYGAVIGTEEPKSVRVGEWLPWYTTPPQRKPLTDEQLIAAYESEQQGRYGDHIRSLRAIEAKLKEKNNG